MSKEAAWYRALPDERVQCVLCPAECVLDDGKTGICGCRQNNKGKLYTDNYGETVTVAMDPIEKKPLYHFYPGSNILSVGANCCNLGCLHCQNWSISQEKARTQYIAPEVLVELTRRHNSIGVAFTYTEPMVWYEYIMDTAPLLRSAGMKVVLVSNGYIMPEPLGELIPHVDAANIDLKGMRPEFYSKVCKGKLEPVLKTLTMLASSNVHLEITNLIIPGKNDSDDDIQRLVDFVASLSPDIPLHLSAYHPEYKLNVEATPADTMLRALMLARRKLKYVYVGNMMVDGGSDTKCPECGHVLIRRTGYRTMVTGMNGTRCEQCGKESGMIR